ncbi:hypothetical protein KSS87_004909 [Heliosperma pusillum]|nr:hypothetical protein KSS87_004909 [Heliosperma pusillum]
MSLWIFYFRQPRSYCKLSRQCRRGFWSVECTSKYGRRQPVTLSGSLMIPTAVTSVALLPLRTLYRGHKRALQVVSRLRYRLLDVDFDRLLNLVVS